MKRVLYMLLIPFHVNKLANLNIHITVFEHQTIKLNQVIDGVKFDEDFLKALQSFYGNNGVPFYSLTHNGVRFNEHVGVLQIGNKIIEVLPKADNGFAGVNEKIAWRDVLIGMLLAVRDFDVHAPSSSSLNIKTNSILDLYFELFIREVEYLLHNGLIKQYRKTEGNVTALKGNLNFGKHIQMNVTHQERFYVKYTTYDVEHHIHFILYKTIKLLNRINTNVGLHSRIGSLLLHFPEMPDVKVSDSTFDKIVYTRKNSSYKPAIDIARLLLLKYHPDVNMGRNNVLALMFDMNKLWEQFVYVSLRSNRSYSNSITAQTTKNFWKPNKGKISRMRPDIVINKSDKEHCVVLDTKWKNLNGYNPSPEDLRQMYVYHQYYGAKSVALVYPGEKNFKYKGNYIHPQSIEETSMECSVITIVVESNVKKWQENICRKMETWFLLDPEDKAYL